MASASRSARAGADSRAMRAFTASRTVSGYERAPESQRLGHEERVSGRPAVELAGVEPRLGGKLTDRLSGQRRELQASHGIAGRKLAEHDAQRMVAVKLVAAVREHKEQSCVFRLTREDPHDIERRLVGPVHVLDDQDGRRDGTQRLDERDRDIERLGTCGDERLRLAAQFGHRLQQWTERPWREQRVARARQPRDPARKLVAKLSQQGRLADSCLAGHQQHPTTTVRGHLGGTSVQHPELIGSLQQPRSIHARNATSRAVQLNRESSPSLAGG